MKPAEIMAHLQQILNERRYRHTLGVVQFALEMAKLYGSDAGRTEMAALLHDCARCMLPRELLAAAEAQGLPVDDLEREMPDLLHGKVGAYLARARYGVSDPEVLRAIELHTLGAQEMTTLDKIIFVADMVEPGRDFPGVVKLREMALRDLDRALLNCFDSTVRFVLEKQQFIHPQSVIARNALLLKLHKAAGT